MDPSLYEAAASGDTTFLIRTAKSGESIKLLQQKTPYDNNILHIAAEFNQISFFKHVPLQSPLLWATNKNGDTPLHVAARVGCPKIVEFLIQQAKILYAQGVHVGRGPADGEAHKKLLRMANMDLDTALHVAVRFGNVGVAVLLIEADPELCCSTDTAKESLLFLATSKGHSQIALYILERPNMSPSYHGINGVTALHAAVTHNHKGAEGIVKIMVTKIPEIVKEVDAVGWTPLHYAAVRGNLEATRVLISACYIVDKSGISALHVAAYAGHTKIVEEFIRIRPDTCDLLSEKGQTVLHAAVSGGQRNVVRYILSTPKLGRLINKADKEGNTPLHLAAIHRDGETIRILTHDCRVDKAATNNKFSKAFDIFASNTNTGKKLTYGSYTIMKDLNNLGGSVGVPYFQDQIRLVLEEIGSHKERASSDKINNGLDSSTPSAIVEKSENSQAYFDKVSRIHDTRLIVAALIATVTFTAAFAMPGGFKSDGVPVLNGNIYFQLFQLFNLTTFLFSTLAIYIELVATAILKVIAIPSSLIQYCIGGLVVAFAFGTLAAMPSGFIITPRLILLTVVCLFVMTVACVPTIKYFLRVRKGRMIIQFRNCKL